MVLAGIRNISVEICFCHRWQHHCRKGKTAHEKSFCRKNTNRNYTITQSGEELVIVFFQQRCNTGDRKTKNRATEIRRKMQVGP